MGFRSLKTKLALAACLLVVTSGLALSLLATRKFSESLLISARNQAENLAHALAMESADKVLTNDLVAGSTKPMIGKLQFTQTMRHGVISFALGFGHWATGTSDFSIDGRTIKGEPKRATGVHANAAMWVDPALKNTCMPDSVGGSVSFYDTMVKLIPAGS